MYSSIYMIQLHCILNFVLFPNLILATWHSKMVWHVILWILSEWHWQHYQHCTVQHWQHYQHCWTLTTLSTLFNIDSTIINRVSTVHALQFSELQSRIRFTSHRWSSIPEIASISFAEYIQQIKLANLISLLQKEPPIISFYWCQCRSVRKAYWIFMKGLSLESFYLQSPGNIFSSSGDFWEVGNNGKAPSAVQRHKFTPNRCLNRLNIDPHYVGHKGVKIDLYYTTMGTKRTMVTNPITGT